MTGPSGEQRPDAGAPGLRWLGDGALRPPPPDPPLEVSPPATRPRRSQPETVHGLVLATVRRRAAAWVVDALLKLLLVEIVLSLGGVTSAADPFSPSLLIAGQLLSRGYEWIFTTRGWTPGSRLLGMRIVRVEDGAEPGPPRALLRVVGAILSELAFGLGFAWALYDRRRQTWHDRLARTVVVMASRGDRD